MPKNVDILREESIHVCMGTKEHESGDWLWPLVGPGFKPQRGLIQRCADYCPHSGGSDSHCNYPAVML